jgi:hypothetical protein
MAQLDLIVKINATRIRLRPTVSIQKNFDTRSVRQGSERYEPADLRTFMSCMNSARDAGGRPPKLDLIHRLQSRTNDAGHNANLTYRETLSIMVTARYECKVSLRREIRLQEQCSQTRRVARTTATRLDYHVVKVHKSQKPCEDHCATFFSAPSMQRVRYH